MKDYKKGFRKGVGKIKAKDLRKFREEACKALNVETRMTLNRYKNGRVEPKASEAAALEKLFKKYGVTTNIWGNDDED
ncbi:MAG: hypothetical protein LBL94_08975 [Prevotellaceae bacterium]|jgi:hypothetical protein|nr:hypothetical protein [Prevotellaceae bacterium]